MSKPDSKDDMPFHYFAYGTNMDVERMKDRLKSVKGTRDCYRMAKGDFEVVAAPECWINGWGLVFNKVPSNGKRGEGYANLIRNRNSSVWGVLYRISIAGMDRLDCFEGVAGKHYYRCPVDVVIPFSFGYGNSSGGKVDAFTYIAYKDRTDVGLRPTREYLDHLLKGQHYLPEKYFRRLEAIETRN